MSKAGMSRATESAGLSLLVVALVYFVKLLRGREPRRDSVEGAWPICTEDVRQRCFGFVQTALQSVALKSSSVDVVTGRIPKRLQRRLYMSANEVAVQLYTKLVDLSLNESTTEA